MVLTRWGLIGLSLLLLVGTPVRAELAADWQQLETASSPGQVATWVREVAGSPIKEFRGEILLDSGPLPVLALLADTGALDRWIFQCAHAERLPADPRHLLYLRFDMPWPVANRDVVMENMLTLDGDTLLLRSRKVAGVRPKQEGLVRISDLDNRFLVTPLESGRTRVVFRSFVDPGGSIPAWLSNFVATNAPLETLRGMRELVNQEPWRGAGLEDLPEESGFRELDLEAWLKQTSH